MPVMKQPAFTIAVIFLCIASLSRAETPASQPTTEPATRATTQQVARPDANSPMGFLLKYDNLAGQGPEAYHALYSIDTNADSRRLAEVQAKFDAQAGMLQKMVELLWGDDAVDQTLHALGLKTMRDIQSATIKEQGDRAGNICRWYDRSRSDQNPRGLAIEPVRPAPVAWRSCR